MLRLVCMCDTQIYVPVRMYSHILQRQKACTQTRAMLNLNIVSGPKFNALSNGALSFPVS